MMDIVMELRSEPQAQDHTCDRAEARQTNQFRKNFFGSLILDLNYLGHFMGVSPMQEQSGHSKKWKKSKKSRSSRNCAGNPSEKTGHFQRVKKSKYFFMRRFRAGHGCDISDFLSEVDRFVSWVYQNSYRKRTLMLVPDFVQEKLNPSLSWGLLRQFAHKNRRREQQPPNIIIDGKNVVMDIEKRTLTIHPYRNSPASIVLPMPDTGDVEIKALLWIRVDEKDVEMVCGLDFPPMSFDEGFENE